MKKRAEENLGCPMVYDLCDCIKEQIVELNDKVVNKFNGIVEEERIAEIESKKPKSYSVDPTSFTPVTAETFAAFCIKYKERMDLERE